MLDKPDGPSLGLRAVGGTAVVVVVAVLVGLQLGALPWRYRRQILQLQGALAGGAVGCLIGYGIGRSSSRNGNRPTGL